MIDRVARIWLLVLASAYALSASAFAQSGLHNPEAPLLVLPYGESPALLAAADRLYREAQKSVSELEAAGLNAEKIGATNVTAVKLQRIAERLKNRHEAAGIDYALRASDFQQRLLAMAIQGKKVAGFIAPNSAPRLAALREAGLAKIPGWTKQVAAQPEQVEQELFALLYDMQEHLIWLEASGASEYIVPFQDLADAVRGRRAASDKQAVEAELDQELAEPPPDGGQLLADLRAAALEIQQHGQASWQGQMLRGPELLPAAYQHWQQLQVEFARRRALLWARRGTSHEHTWELKEVEAAQRGMTEQMPAALAAVVAADAQRIPVTDAEAVYQQYVSCLGPLLALGPKEPLLAALQPALDQLADNAPTLHANLKSYRALTGDLLRWRKRLATAEANSRRAEFPLATAAYNEAAKSRLHAPGFLPELGQGSESSAIVGPVPGAVRRLGEALSGKPVTILDVVGDERRGAARYHIRTFATTPPVDAAASAGLRASLRELLFLAEDQQPLTLDGAAALAAAEQGTFSQVGGSIENVQVAPLIARFATLKDTDALRLALAPLPEEPVSLDLRTHLVVQLLVKPAWVQHELLLVELK